MTKNKNDSIDEKHSADDYSADLHSPSKGIKKRKANCSWSDVEYNLLVSLVRQFGEDWNKITKRFSSKTAKQCMQKFKNSQRSGKKGNWSKEEDELLVDWVKQNGSTKWTECSKFINGRCGKQCRERWVNILNPDIKKGDWSEQEQEIIFSKLPNFMTSWSLMSGVLVGRTENSIKNYFYSSVRRIKSNPIMVILRETYFGKREETSHAIKPEMMVAEVEKLNVLARRICDFLLRTSVSSNNSFKEFLLSVLFVDSPESRNLQDDLGRELPMKTIVDGKGAEENFAFKESLVGSQQDSRLVIPNETVAVYEPETNRRFNASVLVDIIKQISSLRNCTNGPSFLKYLEDNISTIKIINNESKIQLRLPSCWNCHRENCHRENCHSHILGN